MLVALLARAPVVADMASFVAAFATPFAHVTRKTHLDNR